MDENRTLTLTADEATVLWEFLRRSDDEDRYFIADEAERQVLWSLELALQPPAEKVLSPVFEAILMAARNRIRASIE